MKKKNESGKLKLIKGALAYLWEELKTMNRRKLRAMVTIISGYLSMKFRKNKRLNGPRTSISQYER